MPLFKTKPNLPTAERARIEFHFQQIVECLGVQRSQAPVHRLNDWLVLANANVNAEPILGWLGDRLCHDIDGLSCRVVPTSFEPSGGGG